MVPAWATMAKPRSALPVTWRMMNWRVMVCTSTWVGGVVPPSTNSLRTTGVARVSVSALPSRVQVPGTRVRSLEMEPLPSGLSTISVAAMAQHASLP